MQRWAGGNSCVQGSVKPLAEASSRENRGFLVKLDERGDEAKFIPRGREVRRVMLAKTRPQEANGSPNKANKRQNKVSGTHLFITHVPCN